MSGSLLNKIANICVYITYACLTISMIHGPWNPFFFFLNNMSFHHLKLKLLNHVQENTAIRHTLQTNCQGRLITISW